MKDKIKLTDIGNELSLLKRILYAGFIGLIVTLSFVFVVISNSSLSDRSLLEIVLRYGALTVLISLVAYWYLFLTPKPEFERVTRFTKFLVLIFSALGFNGILGFNQQAYLGVTYLVIAVLFTVRYYQKF